MTTLFSKNQTTSRTHCRTGIAPEWIVLERSACREFQGLFAVYGYEGIVLARVPGRVIEWNGLPADVYLFNPPLALRRHPHGRCLQLLKPSSRWYKLHWERPALSFDQARAYVENLMSESIQSPEGIP